MNRAATWNPAVRAVMPANASATVPATLFPTAPTAPTGTALWRERGQPDRSDAPDAPAAPPLTAPPSSLASGATRPTVLYVHQSSDLYGSDRVLLEGCSALSAAGGHPIVVLPPGGPLVEALRQRQIECHTLPAADLLKLERGGLGAMAPLRLAVAVPRMLRRLDSVVAGREVHLVQSNTLAVLGGALWAQYRRRPHLWHVHEIIEQPRIAARVLPWLVRHLSTHALCNSLATRRWLLRAEPGLAARSSVAWNGSADMRALATAAAGAPSDLATRFRPGGARLAIGLVGRINRWKGQCLLVDAAERLAARGYSDFSLVFVGSPPHGQDIWQQRLRQRIAASPLASRICETGFVADMADTYAALDIVCVPSLEPEPFGLVAVEAMSAGLPVVASAGGGLSEVVVHGGTGLLHTPRDADALADALAPLLADPLRRQSLGAAGRRRWEREFSAEAMGRRLLHTQQQCLRAHRP